MNKKVFYTAVMAITLVLSGAQAADEALNACISKTEAVAEKLDLEFEASKDDQIGPCLSTYIQVNIPRLHVLAHESQNSCGFYCSSKWSLMAKTYDQDDYVDLLKKRTDQKDLDKIEAVTGESLEHLVAVEYIKVEADKSKKLEYGLPLLKNIILAFSKASINAQVLDLKIEHVSDVVKTVEGLDKEIKSCLDVVTTEDGIQICVDKFTQNTVYKIGRYTLDVFLDNYFKDRLQPSRFVTFKDAAVEDYDVCAIEYFFNEAVIVDKASDKILPCVYNSLFNSFLKIAEDLVLKNSKMNEVQSKSVVVDLVDKCGDQPMATLKRDKRLKELQKLEVEDFKNYLLNCQKSLTVGVVTEVGTTSISEHPTVVQILGEEKASRFAADILRDELPLCFQKLGTKEKPELCKNYLFAKTAYRIFPLVLEQKFIEYRSKYPFLDDELIKKSNIVSQLNLKYCQEKIYEDFNGFSSMAPLEAEVLTANCLRKAILSSLEQVVDEYVKSEIDNNKILKANGIEFGPSKKEKLKTDFFSCAALNIETREGLKSVVESSSTFLKKCILSLTKGVVLETFGTIVLDKLLEVGLNQEQVAVVYADYKGDPENLLDAVSHSASVEEIESKLVNAEDKIIISIAQNVIKFLILNQAPIKFEPEVSQKLSFAGAEELTSCLATKELPVCAVEVKGFVMQKALDIFLPQAIYDVFKEKLAGLVSDKDFESFDLKTSITAAVETTADGAELKKIITKKISDQVPIEEIKEMKEVNDFVVKHIFMPISSSLIRAIIIKKSPVEFSKSELSTLVGHGQSRIGLCLDQKNISICAEEVETDLMKKAIELFLPKAVYEEFNKALKGVVSSSEIKSYGILSKIEKDLKSSDKGRSLISYIAQSFASGRSIEQIKKDKKVVSYIVDVALEPIASSIIEKLVLKKSPIKFSSSEMEKLVSEGKTALLTCLRKGNTAKCAGEAERALLKKAVVLYLPKTVEAELQESLSNWFTKQQVSAYGLKAKFTQSLTTGRVGQQTLAYIAAELGKGVSAKKLKTLPKVTAYISLVLSSYKAPGTSGLKIIDHIGHKIIQKEIDKFIAELNRGEHGGFFKIGFKILFLGDKAKTAFIWSNSKKTKSGKLASAKLKSIFNRVIEKGSEITDKDTEDMKELVKDAVLEYRNLVSQPK